MGFRSRRVHRRSQRIRRQEEMYQSMKEEYEENESNSNDGDEKERRTQNAESEEFRRMIFRKKERNPHMAFMKFFFYACYFSHRQDSFAVSFISIGPVSKELWLF